MFLIWNIIFTIARVREEEKLSLNILWMAMAASSPDREELVGISTHQQHEYSRSQRIVIICNLMIFKFKSFAIC
jgi:hypothetical protein